MKTDQKPPQWTQQPGEPNPDYVALALYCSLGPNRDWIISTDFGSRLWELPMAATGRIPEDTPMPRVCSQLSALLKIPISEDTVDHLDLNGKADARLKRPHARLQRDEQFLTALETMLAALAQLQRGHGLSNLPDQPAGEILIDVENFLKRQPAVQPWVPTSHNSDSE